MSTRPLGRPPLPKDEKRDARVLLSVTDGEMQRLKEAAAKAGVPVSVFCRRAAVRASLNR